MERFNTDFPAWRCTWDVVHTWNTQYWRDNPQCWIDLELSASDSLMQVSHRTNGVTVDVEWKDLEGDYSTQDSRYRIGPSSTGRFNIVVLKDLDWDSPLEAHHITDVASINNTLLDIFQRYA